MTVEQKIKSVVDQMKGVTYIFDNWQTANVRLDKLPLPAVLNVLPVSGNFQLGPTQLKDYPNCMLAFMDKTSFDFDGKDNDAIVGKCKNMAKEFILLLNRSRLFEPISGSVPYSVFYDKLNVNVTGITISIQLKETSGIVLCPSRSVKDIVYGRAKE